MVSGQYSFNIEEIENKRISCHACKMIHEQKNRAIIKIAINSQNSVPLCKKHFEQYTVVDVIRLLDGSINF